MDQEKQTPRPDTSKNGLLKKFPRAANDPSRIDRMGKIMSKLKSTDQNSKQN